MLHTQYSMSPMDLNILQMLTADGNASAAAGGPHHHHHQHQQQSSSGLGSGRILKKPSLQTDRRPQVDPLLVAAAASAGPE